jgi:hypothetical protein
MTRISKLWPLLLFVVVMSIVLVGCVSSGGGVTPVPSAKITPSFNDNATTAPLPFPPEIMQTMTAQAKSGFVATTPVP